MIGFQVKNTFVEAVDAGEGEEAQQPLVLRSASAPLPRVKSLELDLGDSADGTTVLGSDCESLSELDLSTGSASIWSRMPSSVGDGSPLANVADELPVWPRTMSGDDLEAMMGLGGSFRDVQPTFCRAHASMWSDSLAEASSVDDASAPAIWPRTMSGDDLDAILGFGSARGAQPTFCQAAAPRSPLMLSLAESLPEAPATAASPDSSAQPAAGSAASVSASALAGAQQEPALATLVKQECTWLRVTSCTLLQLAPRSAKHQRSSPGGVTRSLRICVEGLPAVKRHKWQQPLSFAVAGILERAGCPALVKRGELFAALDAQEGELVRLDLCAPRASDEE